MLQVVVLLICIVFIAENATGWMQQVVLLRMCIVFVSENATDVMLLVLVLPVVFNYNNS